MNISYCFTSSMQKPLPHCTWVLLAAASRFDSLMLCCCKPSSIFMHRSAGGIFPFFLSPGWLPCQLSAYGVVECVTDFLSRRGVDSTHIHSILCLRGACQWRFHCSFHTFGPKQTWCQLLECVCVSVCILSLVSSVALMRLNLNFSLTLFNEIQGGKERKPEIDILRFWINTLFHVCPAVFVLERLLCVDGKEWLAFSFRWSHVSGCRHTSVFMAAKCQQPAEIHVSSTKVYFPTMLIKYVNGLYHYQVYCSVQLLLPSYTVHLTHYYMQYNVT